MCKCGDTLCSENEACDASAGVCEYRDADLQKADGKSPEAGAGWMSSKNVLILLGGLFGIGGLALCCFFVVMPMIGATSAAAAATDAGA